MVTRPDRMLEGCRERSRSSEEEMRDGGSLRHSVSVCIRQD